MINDDSYRLMAALKEHLFLKTYHVGKSVEVVLMFKTQDGKLHQICNSFINSKGE